MRSYTLFLLLLAGIFVIPLPAYSKTFQGMKCTKDCSGHKAGYEWAQKRGITSPKQCGGKSNSFTEGCQIWATEHQHPSTAHSDDKKVSIPLLGK